MEFLVRFLLGFGLSTTALFLILLVLIQRGRGGGLAGAFGGMGGQSAFGTKAGDVFTKITVAVAAFWIVLCILATNVLGRQRTLFSSNLGSAAPQSVAPLTPAESTVPPGTEPTPPQSAPQSEPEASAKPEPPTVPAATATDSEASPSESAPAK